MLAQQQHELFRLLDHVLQSFCFLFQEPAFEVLVGEDSPQLALEQGFALRLRLLVVDLYL